MAHTPNDTMVCVPLYVTVDSGNFCLNSGFLEPVQTGSSTEKNKKIGCTVSISTTKEARDTRSSLKILFSSGLHCLT